MKKQKTYVLLLISVLTVFLIAASIFKVLLIDEGSSFVIKHLSDGSSIIYNKIDGYQFLVNSEWHHLLLPATDEDVASIKTIAEQNNIPADRFLTSLPTEKYAEYFPLMLLDLNSNHYVNSDVSSAGIIQSTFLGADFMPVDSILNRLKSDEKVNNLYQIEKNNQIIYIVELNLNPEMFKLALFARNNKMIGFFVVTDNSEIYTDLSSFFDETINSLEFVDIE